jgi:uncharacterized phage protein gp47/JayE
MPFERPTLNTIYRRLVSDIEARMTGNTPLLKGALLRVLAWVFAASIHIAYGFITWLGEQILPNTAETNWLDKHAFMWGVIRKASTFAVGNVTFSGVDTTVIPAGTLLQNDEGSEYETLTLLTITGGSATGDIRATEPGEASNFYKPAPLFILQLVLTSPISGIDPDVIVNGEITGGLDEESDEDLRARILERIQLQPAGGAKNDYIRWAKEVDGISKAWAFGNYYGAGSVAVVIYPENPGLITPVHNYISDPARKPLTAVLYVDDIDPVTIHFWIKLDPNDADLQTAITNNLAELLLDEGSPGGTILLSHMRTAISASGVFDYELTQIQVGLAVIDPADDFTLNNFEFPQLGNIVFSAL